MTSHLDLSARKGLPAELRQLLALFPREGWQKAPGFHGLAAFWLGSPPWLSQHAGDAG